MHKPRFLDQLAMELGDRDAFSVAFARGRRAFQPQHVEAKWARDRAANIKHIKLEVTLDFDAKKITGTATHRLSAIAGPLERLEFDAAELAINAVRAGGEPATFETADGKLRIALPRALGTGEEIEIAIDYAGQPRRGLYFVGPDLEYPNKPRQAWTQGEDEDSRYWFPCYDYPNNRTTSEIVATVPEQFTAISNGALVGTSSDATAKTRTFHWRHDVPHSAYLITLAAGEFAMIEERAGSVPVTYYVAPGREDDARRAFGNTPKMIQFFERVIGVPYPYAKYAQVAVSDFIFGGMENTSATTQTDSTLHDARAHLDFKSDPLVAHELAHQWWGDLLTCRDWAHAWLNEGFATYFEALWCEENLGADEFAWNVRQDREGYLDEDANHYRRAIVCNRYRTPIELFDRHLYEKGSLVLHMLRRVSGDDLFFKSLNLYCTRHRGANVITQDLQHAFEDTTGRNLDFFFDQWVYKEGHPEIEVSSAFDDKKKLLSVTVKQTHKTGDTIVSAFSFPVTIALMDAQGLETRHRVEIKDREQVFHFVMDKAPKAVRFDPEHDDPENPQAQARTRGARNRTAPRSRSDRPRRSRSRARHRRQPASRRGTPRRDAQRQVLGRAGRCSHGTRHNSHDRRPRRAARRTQAAASQGAARRRARARQFSRRRSSGVCACRHRRHRRRKLLCRGRGGPRTGQDARRARLRGVCPRRLGATRISK